MSEWQDIARAPKDGTQVLGFGFVAGEINGPDDRAEMAIIEFHDERTDYPGFHWSVSPSDAYACWMKPLLWHALPATPSISTEQGE